MPSPTAAMPMVKANEPGYVLGVALIALLVALFAAWFIVGVPDHLGRGRGTVFLGIYILAWGFMFLASYYFSHKSFFLRGLIYVCEHWSYPASRAMAFFYFALALAFGAMCVLQGVGIL